MGVILPPIPSWHLPAALCWMGTWGHRGEQVRVGLPSPALCSPSAPLGHCHSPDTQTQASALCCIWVSLWAKSISKHKLSGREGKKNPRNTCGFLRGWGSPVNPIPHPLQGMVWPKRLEQGKTPPSLAAESLISGNYARNCFDGSDEVRSFYPKLRSIFSTLQHSF